ncbi:site-specific integrase [Sphingobacterium paludis]|uniref:Phage integrase family protein n=1 Tax=Sphingobacterium paludis TaxID=1476465 RepID=A0A4R7CVL7_9SPHI|nr:hypothetical protein [Sphingobacterium paludis]TDS05978.1 hypothetical protein B0I21_11812 [Sphingobacterium paludis]
MRDLRTLFNAARNRYSDEDLGIIRIKHHPFRKYKVGTPPVRNKERFNTLKQIFSIEYCHTGHGSRAELAKDMYMLSFYLCGTNAGDLYNLSKQNFKDERIEYYRSKTTGRRKDKAFISILAVPEANDLLQKYVGSLKKRYSSIQCLNKALSKGMEQLCKMTGLKDTAFYWGRHSFANVARNDCRMTKDDVALALNHVDMGNRTTDVYLAKDWRIVDDVQGKVIAKFKRSREKCLKLLC